MSTTNPNETPHDKDGLYRPDLNPCIAVIVGTRPGIVMLGPVIKELERRAIDHFVIHTGQHYSPNMDAHFFVDIALSAPQYRIDGTAAHTTHGAQTAHMLSGIEDILLQARPRMVLVGGDANSNLAGALAARKLGMALGHVEAGERSFDWSMPEEHNRRMIDHISDYLFVTGENAVGNLEREGVQGAIVRSGNPIVDASREFSRLALARPNIEEHLGVADRRYAILTMHRQENVDNPERLQGALQGVSDAAVALGIPTLFFVHPRTQKRLEEFSLLDWLHDRPGIELREPAGYLDFLAYVARSELIFTDSGGVQQEACIHGINCVTLRDSTEWVETIGIGANRLAGCEPMAIVDAAKDASATTCKWEVPFGDGHAAARIVDCAVEVLK